MCGLPIVVASLVAEHWLQASVGVARRLSSCGLQPLERRLSGCGARALLPYDMWDLPGPVLEPVFPALVGGFLTTAPPGKPQIKVFKDSVRGEGLRMCDQLMDLLIGW